MNWTQAMAAMIEGQKVRCSEWHPDRWVSAEESECVSSYTFRELRSMEWEVYAGPCYYVQYFKGSKGATK